MKILVCFKIVPDLDNLTAEEREKVAETQDLSYNRQIFSYYDEAALETALSLSDKAKELDIDLELSALTIVGPDARVNNFIDDLHAVKFDNVIKIESEDNLDYSSQDIAKLISEYVNDVGGFDAILMGRQSSVADQGVTPGYLAELLELPFIPYTLDMELTSEGIFSESMSDIEIRQQLVDSPAVYALDNSVRTYLRIATLVEKMASRGKEAIVIDKEIDSSVKSPFNLYNAKSERDCTFITGDSPKEKAEKLYELYLKGSD